MDDDFCKAVALSVIEECEALNNSDGPTVYATSWAWALRHEEGVHSIRYMDDDELKMAVVEDLVLAVGWCRKGFDLDVKASDLLRFVPDDDKPRVQQAFADSYVQSLISTDADGYVSIHPHHLQDAMDYCGVVIEGEEFLTDDVVYRANPNM